MKQNVRNIKQRINYKKRRIIALLLLIALIILIITIYKTNTKTKIIADIGKNALNINGTNIDISKVISTEPNPPLVGAGMIPIKWDESLGQWVITTKTDKDWYDYSKGKWANVMLSDRNIFI